MCELQKTFNPMPLLWFRVINMNLVDMLCYPLALSIRPSSWARTSLFHYSCAPPMEYSNCR